MQTRPNPLPFRPDDPDYPHPSQSLAEEKPAEIEPSVKAATVLAAIITLAIIFYGRW